MSSREGYHESVKFNEFDGNGELDKISPKVDISEDAFLDISG